MVRTLSPLVLLALAFVMMLPQREGRIQRGENDFVQFYIAAESVGTPRLVDARAFQARQKELIGSVLPGVLSTVRPPAFAWLYFPMAALPYRLAFWAFEAVLWSSLVGFVWISRHIDPDIGWWVGLSLPLLCALMNGQDLPLILLCIVLAMRAYEQKRFGVAGVFIALCTMKFHFFVLWPLALLRTRSWRTIFWASATCGAILGLSFPATGRLDWIPVYWANLTNPQLHVQPELMGTLESLAGGPGSAAWLLRAVALAATTVVLWKAADWQATWAAVLIAGRLLPPHAYVHDLALLLPAYLLLKGRHSFTAAALRIFLLPFLPFCLFLGQPWTAIPPLYLLATLLLLAGEIAFRPTKVRDLIPLRT